MNVILIMIVVALALFGIFLWAGSTTLEDDYRKRGIKR